MHTVGRRVLHRCQVDVARRLAAGAPDLQPGKPEPETPTYTSVGNKLGGWVRGLGIKDPLVAPNHGWRHRFKTLARKVRMNPETCDAIQGTFRARTGETTASIRRTLCSPRSRSCRGIRSSPADWLIGATGRTGRSKTRWRRIRAPRICLSLPAGTLNVLARPAANLFPATRPGALDPCGCKTSPCQRAVRQIRTPLGSKAVAHIHV